MHIIKCTDLHWIETATEQSRQLPKCEALLEEPNCKLQGHPSSSLCQNIFDYHSIFFRQRLSNCKWWNWFLKSISMVLITNYRLSYLFIRFKKKLSKKQKKTIRTTFERLTHLHFIYTAPMDTDLQTTKHFFWLAL
jgi:hypothetical protein